MAMIKCPECGKDISDKAKKCVSCGYELEQPEPETVETPLEPDIIVCAECGGRVFDGNAESCPTCGAPIELTDAQIQLREEKKKKANKTKIIGGIVAAAVVVIVAVVIGVNVSNTNQVASFNDYVKAYNNALTDMTQGGAAAESLTNTTKNVWNSSITKKNKSSWDSDIRDYYATDFNEALAKMYSDSKVRAQVTTIKTNQETVKADIQKLQGAPDEFSNAYKTMNDLYDTYLRFTDQAINPTGSYQSYCNDVNSLDSQFVSQLKKAQTQIPSTKS